MPFAASEREEMRSQRSSQRGAEQRANWGYLLRKGHHSPVQHIHLSLAPSLLPCTCLCHLGYCGGFSSCLLLRWLPKGPVLEGSSPPVQGMPRLAPATGKAAGAARGAQGLEEYSPKNEATALQILPFHFNFQAHLLFPYVSKHVRYFECDLLRTC